MMNSFKKTLSGWGNYPKAPCFIQRPERFHQLKIPGDSVIARGLGRSYGDAALNSEHQVLLMERLDRFLSFDAETGIVQLEAGVSLEEILTVFVPRGWFLPVTPGTKFATVGGCIACDVHGKNHHVDGTFSNYVTVIDVLMADGSTKRCSRTQNSALFWATVGGMGLTGIIAQAALQLIPIKTAFIRTRHYAAKNLEDVMHILEDKSREEKYSVAWIDCLASGASQGRGIVMQGRHADSEEIHTDTPLLIPLQKPSRISSLLPSWMLNKWSVSLFNSLYYKLQSRKTTPFTVDYNTFFYPLDRAAEWNKLYGKNGFIQYQFVVPHQHGYEAIKTVLDVLADKRLSSYLAVLKKFGEQGPGLLSFPFEGYTLTLDIPITDKELFHALDWLDDIVLKYSGRVYLAKDARMNADRFSRMYPRLTEWLDIKKEIDPHHRFSSDLARRLKLEPAL